MKIFKSAIIFAFWVLTFALACSAQEEICDCKPAAKVDIPLGGFEITFYSVGKVKLIKGKTLWPDGKVFEDIVVEVYEATPEEVGNFNQKVWKSIEKKTRKTACLTDKNGKFCFKDLLKGNYILRIGIRNRDVGSFNHVFVILELDPENGNDKVIKAALQLTI